MSETKALHLALYDRRGTWDSGGASPYKGSCSPRRRGWLRHVLNMPNADIPERKQHHNLQTYADKNTNLDFLLCINRSCLDLRSE